MSFLQDKQPCKSCNWLYDADQLDNDGECRDCKQDKAMLEEALEDERRSHD